MDLVPLTSDRDYADWVTVSNAVVPRRPTSVEESRFFAELEPDHLRLVARRDGVAVGCGWAGALPGAPDSSHGEAWLAVVPEARREGIGSAVLAPLVAHLRTLGKTGVEMAVEDADGLGFAEHLGLREVGRDQTVALELERFEHSGRPLPDGIVLTDLEQRPDLLHAVWEIDCEVSPDIPSEEPDQGLSWEWFRQLLGKPGIDPALVLIALDGEQAVGVAWLAPLAAKPELAMHWMTGVRRPWRGRGIAGALKEAQLVRARERGVRTAITNNELRNEPIRRLNERLGYQREPDRIIFRGPLPGS
jgi:GNAT superfamily N-acetyltransferase